MFLLIDYKYILNEFTVIETLVIQIIDRVLLYSIKFENVYIETSST